jgi:hypothetical protein
LIEAPPSAADIGLDRKEIHEAHIIRDADVVGPGIVLRPLDDAQGQSSSKSKVENNRSLSPGKT